MAAITRRKRVMPKMGNTVRTLFERRRGRVTTALRISIVIGVTTILKCKGELLKCDFDLLTSC